MNKQQRASERISVLATTALLAMGLQSCGSSGSDSRTTAVLFSDPVDAETLATAMTTGSAAGDDNEFWLCNLSGNDTALTYRLYADGTGAETLLSEPVVQSAFSWQTNSANTMTTVYDQSGASNSFMDIQFAGANSVSLVLSNGSTLSCERQPTQPANPPTAPGNNSLSYGSVVYSLTHGFEEEFSYRPDQFGDTHLTSEFSVADAPFVQTIIDGALLTTVLWRPNGASVWLRADLHSPGGDGFQSATFSYVDNSVDDQGPLVADRFFFNEGRFGVDVDENGSIDSESGEFIDITGGTITVDRLDGAVRMSFDVTLANGVDVVGSFSGSFPLFENF